MTFRHGGLYLECQKSLFGNAQFLGISNIYFCERRLKSAKAGYGGLLDDRRWQDRSFFFIRAPSVILAIACSRFADAADCV